MSRFPLSIELREKPVILVGNGRQIRQKAQKLKPFGPELIYRTGFTEADARQHPAMVIVGDTPMEEAEQIYGLCCRHHIPVNVVDVPRLCSFYFPALVVRGDVTVSVSTDGNSPAVAACLRRQIEAMLPDQTEQILLWAQEYRQQLKAEGILQQAIARAFSLQRPLTWEECRQLAREK